MIAQAFAAATAAFVVGFIGCTSQVLDADKRFRALAIMTIAYALVALVVVGGLQ